MKWLAPIRIALFSTVAAALALIIGTSGSYWYAGRGERLVSYTGKPFVTDADGFSHDSYAPGRNLILNVTVVRQPGDCWADYVTVFDGPVIYQMPPRKSQLIADKVVVSDLRLLMVMPDDMPAGVYKVYQVVFPTCFGVDLKPFKPDMHDLTVAIGPK